MGGANRRSALRQPLTSSVNFPAAGVYPYEVDYAKGVDKNLSVTMLAGGIPIPTASVMTPSPADRRRANPITFIDPSGNG